MYNQKLDINEAFTLLKSNYVLESFNENAHYTFVFDENKIIVSSKDFNAKLNPYDFKEIFKDYLFSPIKDHNNEEKIDPQKDNEYYSKLQNKQ